MKFLLAFQLLPDAMYDVLQSDNPTARISRVASACELRVINRVGAERRAERGDLGLRAAGDIESMIAAIPPNGP
jgi:hypothetical protein